MKSSKIIALFIAFVALLWIGSGAFFTSESPPEVQENVVKSSDLAQVRVRLIVAAPYGDEVSVTGRTQASRRVDIKAEINGEVSRLSKEEGLIVKAGDVLAVLEVRDRKSRKVEAVQRVEQRRIEYNAAKKLADKGFNSRVKLAQALADLESAKAVLKQAQVDVSKTTIKAPFDSVILSQTMERGDYASVGEVLFTVVDLDPIEIVAFVSERKVQEIKVGQVARAVFLNGDELEGVLSYVSPSADKVARTFRVILSAPNVDLKIKAGLTAKINIPVASIKAHRISPSILTLNKIGQIGVKIVNDRDEVEFVRVQILADKNEAMWVKGPPEQTRFITVGQDFVMEGQKVKPVLAEGPGLL